MTTYKIWIQVEKVNDEKGIYENIGEPDLCAEFKNATDANQFAVQLTQIGDVIGENFKSKLGSK